MKSVEHSVYKLKELLVLSLSPPGSAFDEPESLASVECDLIQLSSTSDTTNELVNMSDNASTCENPSPSLSAKHNINKSSSYDSLSNVSQSNHTPISLSPSQFKIAASNADTVSTNTGKNDASFSSLGTSQLQSQQTQKSANSDNRFERKIIDEIVKIFQDNNGSFYFSYTYDLTNSIERQQEHLDKNKSTQTAGESSMPQDTRVQWQLVDDYYFWNKTLLGDLVDFTSNDKQSKIKYQRKVRTASKFRFSISVQMNFNVDIRDP